MMFKNGARNVSRRVDVLRNGVPITILEPTEAPEISMGMDRELKMSLQGVFKRNAALQATSDFIRPILILNDIDYPVGEYAISQITDNHTPGADAMEIEAFDKTLLLQQSRLEERFFIASGEKYTDVIQAFLVKNGIQRTMCDESSAQFQTDREDWEIGTPHLTVINALLKEINYADIWFDLNGVARLHKKKTPSAENIAHTYESGETSIIKADCIRVMDIYDKPNVFIVMVSNPDYEEAMYARAENDNPASPLSTVARRRRIVAPVERIDNIASQEDLQEYVDNICAISMLATETAMFETANMPTHGVGDVIALKHEELNGIFEEIEWSMRLGAGEQMSHTVRRVTYL